MNELVGVIPLGESFVEVALHEIERIYGLEQFEGLAFVELFYVGLGGVEDHTLHEVRVPIELHLHHKSGAGGVFAAHVHDAVFACGGVGHHFGGDIVDVGDGATPVQGQEGVEQACGQVDVLAEDFPEGDVSHGAEIFIRCYHRLLYFYTVQRYNKNLLKSRVLRFFFDADNQRIDNMKELN